MFVQVCMSVCVCMCVCSQQGEFCEVSNNSKTDPCAWVARVQSRVNTTGYMVRIGCSAAKLAAVQRSSPMPARLASCAEQALTKCSVDHLLAHIDTGYFAYRTLAPRVGLCSWSASVYLAALIPAFLPWCS